MPPKSLTPSTPVSTSVDDEVPLPPDPAPISPQQDKVPELFSLEHLLRQAGYKETRVFTPEAEKLASKCHRACSNDQAAELADLYASIGTARIMEIRHTTEPNIPLRSSSSVLRSVVLQNADTNQALKDSRSQSVANEESWWGSTLISRAAETVGKSISAMSPPSDEGSLERIRIGLGLAKGGNGVRKMKSNWELSRRLSGAGPDQEDMASVQHFNHSQNLVLTPPRPKTAVFDASVPPAIDSVLNTPPKLTSGQPVFEDDEGLGCPLPMDYEIQGGTDDDMYTLGYTDSSGSDSAASSFGAQIESRGMSASPPLRDTAEVLAGLGLGIPSQLGALLAISDLEDEDASPQEIALAEQEAAAIGQRILASTVEYDEDSDGDIDVSPTPPAASSTPPVRMSAVSKMSTEPLPYPMTPCPTTAITQAMSDLLLSQESPRQSPASPPAAKAKLRAAQSAPMLRCKSRPFLRISPAVIAPPTLQVLAPVICDSQSDMAEDLPPLPTTVTPEPTGLSSLALRARKSLKALRSSFWAQDAAQAPPLPTSNDPNISNKTPILTPRIDWATQGEHFAGWHGGKGHGFGKQRDSIDTMAEVGDPFVNAGEVEIDYSKSFFYKPSTPPGPCSINGPQGSPTGVGKMRRQRSVKTLRAQLLRPVAVPPVPQVPPMYRNGKHRLPTTPPLRKHGQRPNFEVPKLALHSPNAWEEGRPPVEIVLEGDEWDARSIVENWGSGIRRGRGKRSSCYEDDDDFFF